MEIAKRERQGRRYREWAAALPSKDNDLIRFLGKQRDAEVHQHGAKVELRRVKRIQYLVPAVRALRFAELMEGEAKDGPKGEDGLPKWISVTTRGVEHRFNINGQRLRVAAACRRGAILLRSLVQAIEADSS